MVFQSQSLMFFLRLKKHSMPYFPKALKKTTCLQRESGIKDLKEIFWLLFYRMKKVTRPAGRNKV